MHNINVEPSSETISISGIDIEVRYEPAAISGYGYAIAVYAKVADPRTIPEHKRESLEAGWEVLNQRSRDQARAAIVAKVEESLKSIA
jgi:hypothetical protein